MKRSCLCTFWSSCRCHWNHCGFLHVVRETLLFKFHYSDGSFCNILTILLFLCRRLVVSDLGEVLNETDHIRPRYLQCTVCVSLCTLNSVLCTLYSVLCTLYSVLCTLYWRAVRTTYFFWSMHISVLPKTKTPHDHQYLLANVSFSALILWTLYHTE